MSDNLKKIGIPIATIASAIMLLAPAILSTGAFAVPPTTTTRDGGLHFVQGTVDLQRTDGSLTATGEVAGAGQGAGTATLAADVSATVGCITPSGSNEPKGQQEASTTVTATAPFEPTRQGRGEFTVTTEPITIEDFDFECPSANMEETLVGDISFTNILLTIEAQTGTITATFPDQ